MKSAVLKIDGEPKVVYNSDEYKELFDLLSVMRDEDNQEYKVEVSVTVCNGLVYDIHVNDVSIGYYAVMNICKTLEHSLPERVLICNKDEVYQAIEQAQLDTDVYVISLIGGMSCV